MHAYPILLTTHAGYGDMLLVSVPRVPLAVPRYCMRPHGRYCGIISTALLAMSFPTNMLFEELWCAGRRASAEREYTHDQVGSAL